ALTLASALLWSCGSAQGTAQGEARPAVPSSGSSEGGAPPRGQGRGEAKSGESGSGEGEGPTGAAGRGSGVAGQGSSGRSEPAPEDLPPLLHPVRNVPWLGVELKNLDRTAAGVHVQRVFRGSPAARAGL